MAGGGLASKVDQGIVLPIGWAAWLQASFAAAFAVGEGSGYGPAKACEPQQAGGGSSIRGVWRPTSRWNGQVCVFGGSEVEAKLFATAALCIHSPQGAASKCTERTGRQGLQMIGRYETRPSGAIARCRSTDCGLKPSLRRATSTRRAIDWAERLLANECLAAEACNALIGRGV